MFSSRIFICKRHALYAFLPFNFNSADIVTKDTETARNANVEELKESGWDRVKAIFTRSEFDEITLELRSIIQIACMSSFVGAVYGGVLHSKDAYLGFLRQHQATLFKNHFEAKKKLQDQVTIGFAKGAFKWSWRLTSFCTMYTTVSIVVAAYRNKNGILEHIIAGTTAGFLYKFKDGPKAWIVGGILGGTLGLIGGSCTYGLLKLTGMSMQEVRYWQSQWTSGRTEVFKKGMADNLARVDSEIIKERNALVIPQGNTLESIKIIEEAKDK